MINVKNHKKYFILLVLAMNANVLYATDDISIKDMELLRSGCSGKSGITQDKIDGNKALKLTLVNTAPKNYMTVLLNIDKQIPAQKKLCFQIKGNINNKKSFLTIGSVIQENNIWKTYNSRHISINNDNWQQIILGFDSDFKLSDSVYQLRQLKFILNSNLNSDKHKTEIYIRNVQILDPEEVSGKGLVNYDELTIIPNAKIERCLNLGLPKITTYFDFDNSDLNEMLFSRMPHCAQAVNDCRQTQGYRSLLTEKLDGYIEISDTANKADVIVYARAGSGENAAQIIQALNNGKSLLVYGNVYEHNLKEILPVKIKEIALNTIPSRSKLTPKDINYPLFKGIEFNNSTLGRYYDLQLLSGAVLATFDDGSPAIVESVFGKGKILYCAFSPGRTVSDSYFYDELFLRMIYYLSGHPDASAKLSVIGAVLDMWQKIDSATVVANMLNHQTGELDIIKHSSLKALRENNANKIYNLQQECTSVIERVTKHNNLSYQLGMSQENFGRFGWLIGEGLLCSVINKDLVVKNGLHEFFIDDLPNEDIPLSSWMFSSDDHNAWTNIIYTYKWDTIGTAAYKTSCIIPKSWKEKEIYFIVDEGIDDTDIVYFNNTKIGETGTDTENHWIAPRKYRIPKSLIKWGEENKVSIMVRNLRGKAGLGSCPKITVQKQQTNGTIEVKSIDWCHKTYDITKDGIKSSLTMSILSPFVLYNMPSESCYVSGVSPDYAGWMDNGRFTIKNLNNSPELIFNRAKDGMFSANWILLWENKNSKPLLLIFEKQPDVIELNKINNRVSGIKISNKNGIQHIVAGWPFGVYEFDKTPLDLFIQDKYVNRINRLSAMMLSFPVGCDEIFSVDKKSRNIRIINKFIYKTIHDEWNTRQINYAFLPPLVSMAIDKNILASTPDKIIDFDIPTKFGYLRGVTNSSVIHYDLDMPPGEAFSLINVAGYKHYKDIINELFSGGIRWSCGKGVSVNDWTPEYPAGKENNNINSIDLFSWSYGLIPAIKGRLFLSEDNQKKLLKRIVSRFQVPIEKYQYKAFVRFREEPFSGIRYPVLFNSYFANTTKYSPGYGSKVIYGDLNEACTVLAWLARLYADNYGQVDFIKSNWEFLKYGMRMVMVYDDWAYNSSGCRESGAGAWIDMLNCEYPGMINYSIIAGMAGDTQEENNGIYRAAKRMLPTIMRLYFKEYLETVAYEQKNRGAISDSVSTVVGFNEYDGARYYSDIPKGFNFISAMDIFDMSQGFSDDLKLLYKKYAFNKVNEYLYATAYPALRNDDNKFIMLPAYLPPFAFWGSKQETLDKMLTDILLQYKDKLMSDWPGIIAGAKIGSIIFRQEPDVFLCDHSPMNIKKATFNPETKTVNIEVTSNNHSNMLELFTGYQPESVLINGNPVTISYSVATGILHLEFSETNINAVIKLGKENPVKHLMLKGV